VTSFCCYSLNTALHSFGIHHTGYSG
jgi:hypothetical protein